MVPTISIFWSVSLSSIIVNAIFVGFSWMDNKSNMKRSSWSLTTHNRHFFNIFSQVVGKTINQISRLKDNERIVRCSLVLHYAILKHRTDN